jgi:hypothetical protein
MFAMLEISWFDCTSLPEPMSPPETKGKRIFYLTLTTIWKRA